MRRKILLLLVTLLLLGLCSRTNADPKNWPAPWLDTVTLKIGAYNPVLKPDHNGGTWEGKKGAKYAIDFGDNENEGIKLFSPVDGEIVCSNLYEETLAKGNEKSCRNGHGTYGKHVIIKPHGDDNNTFIMAHMTDESANIAKFEKTGDKYIIKKDKEVGYLGHTGGDWPAHLHFEFIKRPYSDKIQVFGITDEQMRERAVIKGGFSEAVKPSITTPKNNATIRKQVNKSFTYTLKAEGSEATWSKKSGSLPTGVRVDSGGTITGTPTQTGQFKFVLQAQNSAGVDTKNVTLDIYGTNEVPKITTTSLTTGKVNENYSFTVKATGRTPITWTASGLPSGLSIDSSTGTISGKTAYSGKFYVQIVAKNKIKSSATKTLWLEIYEKPAITTSSINETAYTFTDYNATFTATGYPAPTWSITVLSQLPPGLTLDPKTGVLSGKPTKTGTYNFKVKATNSVDSATKKFKIVVKVGDPQITTSSLPKGKVGTAYSTQLTGNNLPSGSAWAATSALPAGMTLSKTGVLSGTPKSAGTYYIYAMAINKTGVRTSKKFTLTVTDGLTITTTSLPDGNVGKSYKVTLKATGATAITWFSGTLPQGLTLSSKGVLSGTPVSSGTYYIYARAMNAYGTYVSKTFTLEIVDDLAITTETLSNATVGKSYKATLKATGATAITWFASGTLPQGLTLSSKGVLSGTPVSSGTYYI
ncbi:MAG: putative Ig domain-containing protein, partial [Synergistaceae bacterium]|nr:putative Ig domain-containing protein [Synergistaceae bacterium]